MNVGVIGSGNIGGALARAWVKAGHRVLVGGRDPKTLRDVAEQADVIALAVPFGALDSVLTELGELNGKIVVDCTNPMKDKPAEGSAAERIAKLRPAARVVKSFNTQGFEVLENPVVAGEKASNFYCGNDADAKATVRALIADVGLEPIDAGPLESARLLEMLASLWFFATKEFGTRRTAFCLVHEAP